MKRYAAVVLILPALILSAVAAFGSVTIAEAKLLPDDAPVSLTGKIATSAYGDYPSKVYVEEPDRSMGIQAYIGAAIISNLMEGATVDVTGTMSQVSGERVVTNAVVTVRGSGATLRALGMRNGVIGGGACGLQAGVQNGVGVNNVGSLIRTWGWVSSVDSQGNYVVLDDGSGAPVRLDTSRIAAKPKDYDFVCAAGVVSVQPVSGASGPLMPVVRPRRQSDIVVRTPTTEQQIANTYVGPDHFAVFWLGQAGFLIKDGQGHKIAIDPYLSDYCRLKLDGTLVRLVPVPIAPELLQPGLTLLTHDHGDHMDPYSDKPIYTSSQSVFWGPTSVNTHLAKSDCGSIPTSRRKTLDRGQTATWNGIQITATYANHTSDSVGFVLSIAGHRLYVSGDTLYDSTLVSAVKAQNPDIIICCINGKQGNMTASEAASLVKATSAKVAIPCHYGMFASNTADPRTFVDACVTQGVTARATVLRTFGHIVF